MIRKVIATSVATALLLTSPSVVSAEEKKPETTQSQGSGKTSGSAKGDEGSAEKMSSEQKNQSSEQKNQSSETSSKTEESFKNVAIVLGSVVGVFILLNVGEQILRPLGVLPQGSSFQAFSTSLSSGLGQLTSSQPTNN